MDLTNVETENLVNRWESLKQQYIEKLREYKNFLTEIQKIRNELYLIREELLSRDINVDGDSVPSQY